MNEWKVTIDINGFPMDFGPKTIASNGFSMFLVTKTILVFQWFWVQKPLVAMVFQWFPMVANHWSDGGMVTIHRSGLVLTVLRWTPLAFP